VTLQPGGSPGRRIRAVFRRVSSPSFKKTDFALDVVRRARIGERQNTSKMDCAGWLIELSRLAWKLALRRSRKRQKHDRPRSYKMRMRTLGTASAMAVLCCYCRGRVRKDNVLDNGSSAFAVHCRFGVAPRWQASCLHYYTNRAVDVISGRLDGTSFLPFPHCTPFYGALSVDSESAFGNAQGARYLNRLPRKEEDDNGGQSKKQ